MLKCFCGLLCFVIFSVQANVNNFIINGEDATDQFKYHAHILIIQPDDATLVGSGVVISRKAVLTTALNIYDFAEWNVGFGNVEREHLIWRDTKDGYTHPFYDPFTLEHNIGFLYFELYDLFVIRNVEPINIPRRHETVYPLKNEQGVISGFGQIIGGTLHYADILQIGFNRVVDAESCAELYPLVNMTNNFCAQNLAGRASICGGDQGGPFVTVLNGRPVLTGLTSTILNFNCDYRRPALFVRTGPYREIIQFIVRITSH